jgi:hypothetical protein
VRQSYTVLAYTVLAYTVLAYTVLIHYTNIHCTNIHCTHILYQAALGTPEKITIAVFTVASNFAVLAAIRCVLL